MKEKPKSAYKAVQASPSTISIIDSQNLVIGYLKSNYPIEHRDKIWAVARLFEMAPALHKIAKEFVKRVESGEVKSRATYYKMKEVIEYIDL